MKYSNQILINPKFMETLTKCNEFEDWPPKDAYWFNRFVKKMNSANEDFNDVRNKLIKKYGEEDKEGNKILARLKEEFLKKYMHGIVTEPQWW